MNSRQRIPLLDTLLALLPSPLKPAPVRGWAAPWEELHSLLLVVFFFFFLKIFNTIN